MGSGEALPLYLTLAQNLVLPCTISSSACWDRWPCRHSPAARPLGALRSRSALGQHGAERGKAVMPIL